MSSGGSVPMENGKPGDIIRNDKQIKKEIRKQVKNTLVKLLSNSLIEDKRKEQNKINGISAKEDSLNDCVNFYGILTNSISKESDVIFGARPEYFNGGVLMFYTTDNPKLFASYPAAATYQGPYKTSKKIFVQVFARIDDMYACKAIDQLKYLELLSMKGEGSGGTA